jgi:hypothetical protein
MVLFLRKEEVSQGSAATTTKSGEKWRPPDFSDEMKASAVWIDGGQLYSFQQVMNPGPRILVLRDISLQKMNDRVAEINRTQKQLAEVVRIGNGGARAEDLKPYVRSEVFEAQRLALNELDKCGPSGLKTIRRMLDDPAFADEGPELIKAFVAAGGEAVGGELNNRLQRELAFWQATVPSLPQGWWNQDPTPHAPLRERYGQTLALIRGLDRTHISRRRPRRCNLESFGVLYHS